MAPGNPVGMSDQAWALSGVATQGGFTDAPTGARVLGCWWLPVSSLAVIGKGL